MLCSNKHSPSLDLLPKELIAAVDSYQVVSFDIFDTLLIRTLTKPHDLFDLMEKRLGLNGLSSARIEAEKKARGFTAREEVTLDEIYEQLRCFGYSYEIIQKIKSEELFLEKKVLCANPAIKQIYDYCLATSKRIFIISDMYLPQNFLEDVLRREGYKIWDDIYVSGVLGLRKSTGNLFRKFLSDHSLSPSQILHIGDNKHSDAKQALELGFSSFCCDKLFDVFKTTHKFKRLINASSSLACLLSLGNTYASSITSVSGTLYKPNSKKDFTAIHFPYPELKHDTPDTTNYWEDFGFYVAAPIVCAFAAWIKESVSKNQIDNLLFIGRDGYILERIFKKYFPQINSKYIFAPRYLHSVVLAKACLNDNSLSLSRALFESLIGALKARNVIDENILIPELKDDNSRKEYLLKLTPDIESEIDQILSDYRDYLCQHIISTKNTKIGIVDSHSVHLSSQKLLSYFLPENEIHGIYMSLIDLSPETDLNSFRTSSFLGSERIIVWDIMELILSAPYPGISGIINNSVIFNDLNKYESLRNEATTSIHAGILRFAQKFIERFGNLDLLIDPIGMVSLINEFSFYPTETDLKAFSVIKHASDAASKNWRQCIISWPSKPNKYGNYASTTSLFKTKYLNDIYIVYVGKIPLFFVKVGSRSKKWKIFGIPVFYHRI